MGCRTPVPYDKQKTMSLQFAVQEWRRVMTEEAHALRDFSDRILSDSLLNADIQKALELIQASLQQQGQVLVVGLGKSGKIAQKIASTLSSTGTRALYLHPTEALHGDLGLVRSSDVAWMISQSGNTVELIELAHSFKRKGIRIMGQGGNSKSTLAGLCDVWISSPIESEACPLQLAPTTSTALSLAIGDGLAVAMMALRDFTPESFLENHPGGALGRRLRTRVRDWMLPLSEVGLVDTLTPSEQVIVMATEFKCGAVLVVDHPQAPKSLLGIITDGDIRRALMHRERFFSMTAGEIMTASPIVAAPDDSSVSALSLMEQRPSQIHVLPVIENHQPVGLLRLHDLVRSL